MDAIHSGDTSILKAWLSELHPPSSKTTFFNFTASHDGIGVRPLEGLVPDERLEKLVNVVRERGGMVNTRRTAEGQDRAYELNLTYFSAVSGVKKRVPKGSTILGNTSFDAVHKGVPAVYFHSLVGSPNDYEGITSDRIAESIGISMTAKK